MTARQTGQRFRQRKLSVKQNLTIVKEHEIETTILDDEAQRNIPKVETGVEKGEEIVSTFFTLGLPHVAVAENYECLYHVIFSRFRLTS
jgi:hypothetical protein